MDPLMAAEWLLLLPCRPFPIYTPALSSCGCVLPVHAGKENWRCRHIPGPRPRPHKTGISVKRALPLSFVHLTLPPGFLISGLYSLTDFLLIKLSFIHQ